MILSAHQPAYLPWLGYFHKIISADVFVILDDVQYETNSFINRNRIKTPQGTMWLTVPVLSKGHFGKTIRQMPVVQDGWWRKHWAALQANYGRTRIFRDSKAWLSPVYESMRGVGILQGVLEKLSWIWDFRDATSIRQQSHAGVMGHKQELIVNLCKHFGADAFLFGAKGREYVDVGWFKQQGIACYFQEYHTPEYPQPWGEFVPDLAIVDALFNVGAEETKRLIKTGGKVTKGE